MLRNARFFASKEDVILLSVKGHCIKHRGRCRFSQPPYLIVADNFFCRHDQAIITSSDAY